MGAQFVDLIQHQGFDSLDAPVLRVVGADVPMHYAKNLEHLALPDKERGEGGGLPGALSTARTR